MVEGPPRLFISYSHDSVEHKARVLALADRLRGDGIDARIDQYEESPPEGWPLWMERELREADFVLVVCTETYRRRFDKDEEIGKGLGGLWEGDLIRQYLFEKGGINKKFVPLLFTSDDAEHRPDSLRSTTYYRLNTEDGYENLYRRVTRQLRSPRPELGELRRLPSREARWTDRPPRRLVGVPPSATLFVGRDAALASFKRKLGILPPEEGAPRPPGPRRFTTISGLPGVGKSTFVAALARDHDIRASFPDGVFWTALSHEPGARSRLTSTLGRWSAALGDQEAQRTTTFRSAAERLREVIRERRVLLVVDDVWDSGDAASLHHIVDGQSTALITTRIPDVAASLVPVAEDRYILDVLSVDDGLELLSALAPAVVMEHRQACRDLVTDLGCHPLALHVAGRLLQAQGRLWNVEELIDELRSGAPVLGEEAPPDMAELTDRIPTVAALLDKSTRMLDEELRERFAELGSFSAKPATFDLAAMAALWVVDDPRPAAVELARHGLIEPLGEGRFQMHAILVAHARSLLGD